MTRRAFPLIFLLLSACASPPEPAPGPPRDEPAPAARNAAPPGRAADRPALPAARPDKEVRPPAHPAAPAFKNEELLQRGLALARKSARAVTDRGRPLSVIHDLNGDGLADLFLLTVETSDPSQRLLRNLADFSKVFQDESPALPLFLEVFVQKPGRVLQALTVVALGSYKALESFAALPPRAFKRPFGIALTAPSAQGRSHLWCFVQPSGRFALFGFEEHSRRSAVLRDVDRDGAFDLLLFESGFEDGSGVETYVHRYRWNGFTFRQVKSVNILRNLRAFLQRCRELALAGRWPAFLEYTLEGEDYARLRGLPLDQALKKIFQPAIYGQAGDDPVDPAGIQEELPQVSADRIIEVVFPKLMESPFAIRDNEVRPAVLPVKVVSSDGELGYYTIRLELAHDPFGPRVIVVSPD